MTRFVGGFLYFAGIVGTFAAAYLASALRNYVDYTNQSGYIWPYFAGFLAIAMLLCEAGRSSFDTLAKKLLLIQVTALTFCIIWFILS